MHTNMKKASLQLRQKEQDKKRRQGTLMFTVLYFKPMSQVKWLKYAVSEVLGYGSE